jgi:hypothetical protein
MSFELAISRDGDEPERSENKLDYLPFGVKTLKVEVNEDYKGKLHLRPRRLSSVPGEKSAHEDEGDPPRFVVSWGGGHEEYYELDCPKKRFAHFLVHHVGKSADDQVKLTIVAEDENGSAVNLPVTLTVPTLQGSPLPQGQLVQPYWEETRGGLDGSCDIRLTGVFTPRYISRWWPKNRVEYTYDKQPPQVRLHHRRLVEATHGDLRVYASQPGDQGERLMAEIRGSIGYPLYDMRQVVPELYRFGPQSWVLRVWASIGRANRTSWSRPGAG